MSNDPSLFTLNTKDILAKRTGQTCSNPDCGRPTSIAHTTDNKAVMLGEAAHIFGRQPKSKRYDPNMTLEQRGAISNGLWLCKTCHKMIDTDEIKYKPSVLFKWKSEREQENQNQAISKTSYVNYQDIPVLDLHHTIGRTGSSSGHFITLTVINKSNFYAQDCICWLEGFGYRHDLPITPGHGLEKNEKIDFKIELDINQTDQPPKIIRDLEFNMKYSNIYGRNFISKRKLNQKPVEANIYNYLSLGSFSPPKLVTDLGFIYKNTELLPNMGGGRAILFTLDFDGEEKLAKIKISDSLLVTWGFHSEGDIREALIKLGKIKVENMIELNNIYDYTFTNFDFSSASQVGYDGFKKACALLEK